MTLSSDLVHLSVKKMKIAIDATSTISILFGVTLYCVINLVSIDTFQSSAWWFNDGLSWRRHLHNHICGLADLAGTLDFSCHVKMFIKLKCHLLIPVFHRVLWLLRERWILHSIIFGTCKKMTSDVEKCNWMVINVFVLWNNCNNFVNAISIQLIRAWRTSS